MPPVSRVAEPSADAHAVLGGSIATFDALAGEIASTLAPAPPPELTTSQRQALVRPAAKYRAPTAPMCPIQ